MRLALSFAALFLSVILLQLSSGGVGPLDALSGLQLGFTAAEVGLLGSAHFVGFFLGCWWAPRAMGSVGAERAFAAFTALGAIGLMAHMLVVHPWAWAAMRVATGLCVAGCYTVIEAWLQGKVENDTRARAMGLYRVFDMGASLAAQLLIGVLAPASYVSYNLLAILCCAALLPLALTRTRPPAFDANPALRPLLALKRSPLAVAAVAVAGLTTAAFRMVGPLYGQAVGLRPEEIGFFLAAFVAGGAATQLPTGWLADRYDRRKVLIGVSAAAIGGCWVMVVATDMGQTAVFLAAGLFGFLTFPIYSIAAAHAHDFASQDERVELSAALLFYYALGAIASPLAASALIDAAGPQALFYMVAAGHAVLVAFGLLRMRVRRTPRVATRYVYAPRTSFLIGRLLRSAREGNGRSAGRDEGAAREREAAERADKAPGPDAPR